MNLKIVTFDQRVGRVGEMLANPAPSLKVSHLSVTPSLPPSPEHCVMWESLLSGGCTSRRRDSGPGIDPRQGEFLHHFFLGRREEGRRKTARAAELRGDHTGSLGNSRNNTSSREGSEWFLATRLITATGSSVVAKTLCCIVLLGILYRYITL